LLRSDSPLSAFSPSEAAAAAAAPAGINVLIIIPLAFAAAQSSLLYEQYAACDGTYALRVRISSAGADGVFILTKSNVATV
jgi:hypothetical protein